MACDQMWEAVLETVVWMEEARRWKLSMRRAVGDRRGTTDGHWPPTPSLQTEGDMGGEAKS